MTIAIKSVICLFTFIAAAAAQDPQAPSTPRIPGENLSVSDPTVPPEQFAPCVGIMDPKRRDACIAGQTSKGNPVVPGPETNRDTQPGLRPKADPRK